MTLSKFDCVNGALPNKVLEKVEHILTGVPQVGGRYVAIQNALTESYGWTTAQNQSELIKLTVRGTLGDLKPTDFLMRVRGLSGSEYETVERAILLNALPPAVRTVLAVKLQGNQQQAPGHGGQPGLGAAPHLQCCGRGRVPDQ